MDLGETGINIILGILVFVVMIANIFFRKRKTEKTPIGMIASLLSEVKQNQKLVEAFSFHWRHSKFKTGSWMRNKNKIDFLPQELQVTLSKFFDMAEGFNQSIDAAKKHKSDSYMAGIDVDKLKEPLNKSKEELQEWFEENTGNPEYMPKRRGLFG